MKNFRRTIFFIFVLFVLSLIGCMHSSDPALGGACGICIDSSGKALSGVTVSAGGCSTVSDFYGKWSLDSLKPQILNFVASKENFQTQTKTYEVQSGIILENITFALPSNTEIYDIVISNVTSTKASISFHTKYEATTRLAYGSNAQLDKSINSSSAHKYTHTFELTSLVPATTYIFQCLGTDKFNRKIQSEIMTFTTGVASRGEPPTGLKISKVAGNAAFSLSWNADAQADLAGYNVYRSTSLGGVFEKINVGIVQQPSYVDMGVTTGEKYCYRVTRVAGSGDESSVSETVSMVMPGVVNTNVVWNSQGSPYEITGDLIITQGSSLIISKGTEVRVAKGDKWDSDGTMDNTVGISVFGTLLVQGTESEPVAFTSAENIPQNGDWEGIVFKDSADLTASNIKGLKVQFAKVGLSGENGLPVISESEFINCSQAGILCNSSVKDINIANCLVSACNTGISINNGSCTVNITDNTITNCSYGITALNNTYNAIVGNKIKTNLATAIEVSGTNPASSVFRNTIGWGTGGVGIICKGMDEIRRNTIQANLCIQVMETAKAVVRSNLMVADKDRNGMGLLFSSSLINSPNLIVQNNGVWNQTLAGKKYGNSFGDAVNVTGDLSFTSTSGPAFQGGDPFTGSITNMNFSYIPSSGSILKHAGFESNEDMGAEDVPN
ncbi:MAG: right-handed parallel beta-helix repeat-containing protein [Candidatus Riflebacteria bacterium]|nr:right-handed parallel beta-helix repeat-containing protein [Candidatus Riflebacteria bacterium]